LLAAEGLWRRYSGTGPNVGSDTEVTAVRNVSLDLAHGESLAIVGRSGSGKSTLARLLLAIERPDGGVVRFGSQAISDLPERRIRPLRRHFQAVFQDPGASLDPCLRVGTIVAEPLAAHGIGSARDRCARVREVLDRVGLPTGAEAAFPDAFSGGERQRIAIARAIAPRPKLIVLDEPVSSLDASVQTEIIDLLLDLRHDGGLALIMISHDLAVVRELCERAAVMHEGSLVEIGLTADVLARPEHPATQALLEASVTLIG
jgi:ABC-type glutathione transport system ATPase component